MVKLGKLLKFLFMTVNIRMISKELFFLINEIFLINKYL